MRKRYHGEPPTIQEQVTANLEAAAGGEPKPGFGFMFGEVAADPENRLPAGRQTIDALRALGQAMAQDPSKEESDIPAVYTYFGQFIDHDITKTVFAAGEGADAVDIFNVIDQPEFAPLTPAQVGKRLRNERDATLDLDSLYGGLAERAMDQDGRMLLSKVTGVPPQFGPIPTADPFHDFKRNPRIPDPRNAAEEEADRQALIGDPRNDENLIVGQLHVGMLRTHNALMDAALTGPQARTAMRRRYQWAVLHDFLPRICQREVIEDVLNNGPSFLKMKSRDEVFIPVEFAGAAYRFGHSMVRASYEHNATFRQGGLLGSATFKQMFTFTALSGNLGELDTLPDNWIIDWTLFFGQGAGPGVNPARRIDTAITPALGELPSFVGNPLPGIMGQLASRNLLRGYLLGLPTGQALATAMKIAPLPHSVLADALPAGNGAREAFKAAGFMQRTPLWFYVLAEAGDSTGQRPNRLGPVGSRIVAETLWNLVLHSEDSVLLDEPDAAERASGEFTLKGLIRRGQDQALPPLV